MEEPGAVAVWAVLADWEDWEGWGEEGWG